LANFVDRPKARHLDWEQIRTGEDAVPWRGPRGRKLDSCLGNPDRHPIFMTGVMFVEGCARSMDRGSVKEAMESNFTAFVELLFSIPIMDSPRYRPVMVGSHYLGERVRHTFRTD